MVDFTPIPHSQILAMTTLQLPHKKIPQKSTFKRVTGPSPGVSCGEQYIRAGMMTCVECTLDIGLLGGETFFLVFLLWNLVKWSNLTIIFFKWVGSTAN